MAEGGDTGEFKGTIAGQAVAFSTNNLTQILLIVCGLVGGYLIWMQLDKRLETAGRLINEQQQAIHAQHVKFFEMLQGNRENTHVEIERVLKALAILSHNMDREPADRIPLGINGLPSPKPHAP